MNRAISHLTDGMLHRIGNASLRRSIGKLTEISATRLATSLSGISVGEVCLLRNPHSGAELKAQAVSVVEGQAILAPIGTVDGLGPDTEVIATGKPFQFAAGDFLLGRVLDGLGTPIDGPMPEVSGALWRRAECETPNPLDRPLIDDIFETGVRVIDGMLTLGEGQRIGVFGDPGGGKSTLLGSLARNSRADVCILGLIGERGREVREFMDRQLPPDFRERCVVVVATADRPAMERMLAAHTAVSLAAYFRERGQKVLLLLDSLTRFARALREVGLAAGEQPVRRGFTPSVYAELPRLIERCGRTNAGPMTAIYTVLTENDGVGDPIGEEVMSLTDGHITLSGKLGQSGHYPAVDVLRSKSRLFSELSSPQHAAAASKARALLAKYQEIELLIQVGEYKAGGDALADEAVRKRDQLNAFLRQDRHSRSGFNETLEALMALAK